MERATLEFAQVLSYGFRSPSGKKCTTFPLARRSSISEKKRGNPHRRRHRDASQYPHQTAVQAILEVFRQRGEDELSREHGDRDEWAVEGMHVIAHRERATDSGEPLLAFDADTDDHTCQEEEKRDRYHVPEGVRQPPVHPAGVPGRCFRCVACPRIDPLDGLDAAVDRVELRVAA